MIVATTDTQIQVDSLPAGNNDALPEKNNDAKDADAKDDKAILAYVLQQPDLVSCYHPLSR